MNPEDLMFVRPDDLTEDERALLDAYLADHPDAAEERAAVLALMDDVSALPHSEPGPSLDALLERLDSEVVPEAPSEPKPANRPRWWLAAPLVAAAAAVVVVVVAQDDGRGRWRGGDGIPSDAVQLEAVAEGPAGPRALADGEAVAADERVVFFATTQVAGTLSLTEGDAVLYPTADTVWSVDAGRHAVGGAEPQSYRPDVTAPSLTYTVTLCDAEDRCVSDAMTLRW